MSTIFFSYSHEDEGFRDRLEVHLAMLKRQGLIDTWHDRRIKAGDNFGGKISQELEKADVILLLVSPDFLASDYCYDVEMTRALEREQAGEARVIPIILRHCDWKSSPFGALLATPKDGKPISAWPDLDEAFLDVVKKIRDALPKIAESPKITVVEARTTTADVESIRSSNLSLRKTFTEVDRDRFLHEAFEYVAKYFENSLGELAARNEGVEHTFRRIDANRFTCALYRNGNAASRCKISLGGMMGRGISYSNNDQSSDNSMNDGLSVSNDDQSLYLAPLGMSSFGRERESHLTFEGAAEYFWAIFIRPLQGR